MLTKLHEIIEKDGIGVIVADTHATVENDDALQCGTQREYPMCLIILLLLANEKDTYLCVIDHKPYLLLAAGGIEGHRDRPDAKSTKVSIKILHGILGEHTYVLLHTHTYIKKCIGDLLHHSGEILP